MFKFLIALGRRYIYPRQKPSIRGDIISMFRGEIIGTNDEVRRHFLDHFSKELEHFLVAMGNAGVAHADMNKLLERDPRDGLVSGFAYTAMTVYVSSMRHFMTGQIIAAGATMRVTIESMAMALLCSSRKLSVADDFLADRYSTQNAVRDLKANWKELSLKPEALEALKKGRQFFHGYSHPSKLILATYVPQSDKPLGMYVGASFDPGKIEEYRKDMNGRVSLAQVFPNFMAAIRYNVERREMT